jgi:hypothetical protein
MLDWTTEVRPVLDATFRLIDDPDVLEVTSLQVADALERPHEGVVQTMAYLAEADYLSTEASIDQASGEVVMEVNGLTEKSLQLVANWPIPGISNDAHAALLKVIDERMVDAVPEERSRLEKLRDGVAGVGRDVTVQVLAELARRQI